VREHLGDGRRHLDARGEIVVKSTDPLMRGTAMGNARGRGAFDDAGKA
jgi:hypothetical protein